MSNQSSPWQRFLKNLKVEHLLGSAPTEELKTEMLQRIAFLRKEDSIQEAVRVLTAHKIISAPVYDDDANQFIGFVDMLDLATCFMTKVKPRQGEPLSLSQFESLPVSNAINLSRRNAWVPLDRTSPLLELFEVLCLPHVHRVPIIDAKGNEPEKKVLAVITQAELIRWLWASRRAPGFPHQVLGMKINQITPAVKESLVLVYESEPTLSAFDKIVANGINGIGVTSADGKLVGNVSATDLRIAAATGWQKMMELLDQPLRSFLQFKGTLVIYPYDKASHPKPITVTPDQTLEAALGKLESYHIHRVWVVQGDQKPSLTGTGEAAQTQSKESCIPLRSVTMTDVLNELAHYNG